MDLQPFVSQLGQTNKTSVKQLGIDDLIKCAVPCFPVKLEAEIRLITDKLLYQMMLAN